MRVFNYVFLIVVGLFCQNTMAQNSKTVVASVSEKDKTLVLDFLEKSFNTCKKEELPKRSSKNYSSRFRKFFTDDKLLEGCNWYKDRYGVIDKINLIEVLKIKESQVFRYKLKRSKADWETEIRVYLNENDKISSLNFKDYWSDVFYDRREDPPLSQVNLDSINKSVLKATRSYVQRRFAKCDEYDMFEANEQNSIYRNTIGDYTGFLLDKCIEVQNRNGLLNKLEFIEMLTDATSRKIYRYKVKFGKLSEPSEIRVLTRLNDKFAGASVIDVWYDRFYEYNKAKSKSLNDLGN